jgi:multicomponent Na+:H+ antiporter subunit D
MPNEINEASISKVYSLWLLAIAGLIGLVTTGDAFNLFVFLEISSLASVALVAMGAQKDKQALVAAYNYLIIGAVGATLYVIGVGLLYGITGTLNMADLSERVIDLKNNKALIAGFGFMIVGIMVKAKPAIKALLFFRSITRSERSAILSVPVIPYSKPTPIT